MVKRQFLGFIFRWLVASVAMFVAVNVFGDFDQNGDSWLVHHAILFYALVGLVFSLVNTVLKPLFTILALPLLRFTLGAGVLVVDMLMVAITIWIMPQISMGVWGVLGSCITVSIVNFLVNAGLNSVK